MAEPLPSAEPLWELLVSPLPDGAAVILRIHHAIADGMAAADLIRQLLDADDGSVDAVAPALSSAPISPRGGRRHRLILGIRRTFATLAGRGLAQASCWASAARGTGWCSPTPISTPSPPGHTAPMPR